MTIVNSLNRKKEQFYETLDRHILELHNAMLEKNFKNFVQAHEKLSPFESVLFTDNCSGEWENFKLAELCEKEFFRHVESDFNQSGIRLEFLLENDIYFYYKNVKVATLYCGDSYAKFNPPILLEELSKYPQRIVELEAKLLEEIPEKTFLASLFSNRRVATHFEREQNSLRHRIQQLKKQQQKLTEKRDMLEEAIDVVPLVFQKLEVSVTPYG